MAIVNMPLYSIRAWGRFYGSFAGDYPIPYNVHNPYMCVYQRRHIKGKTVVIKEKYYIPYNPRTPAQTVRRNKFADGVSTWQSMNIDERAIFELYGKPYNLPGYQRFLSMYMNDKI